MKPLALPFVCVLAASGALAPIAAGADDVPDVATVRAKTQAASGTVPSNERLVETFVYAGTAGRSVTLRANGDFRRTTTFGLFESATGRYHGRSWRQNENGETVLVQPEAGKAVRETYVDTVTALVGPPEQYVVSALNAKGFGTRDYVDAATWRIVRRDVVAATGTRVTTYDDFRTAGGYTRAWRRAIRDAQHPANDADFRIESDAVDAIDPVELTIPPSRRALVTFPQGEHAVALPAKELNDVFVVRANVGERGLDFELDTGASGIVIDDDVARQLELRSYASIEESANAGRYLSRFVVIPELRVGSLVMRDVVASTIPHVGGDGSGTRIVGLLGFDFIDALALKLDYRAGTVTAYPSLADVPARDPRTAVLDVRLGTQQPMVDLTVDGALGERFLLDTGGRGPMLFFDYFMRRYPKLAEAVDRNAPPRRFFGVGGLFETQPLRLGSVSVGALTFHDITSYRVTSATAYSADLDGVVGTDFLKQFNVYVDYADGKVELEPNDAVTPASR